ncbi:MAG TPA: class I SAM-dependent methyltransferase [Pyrinomonadaceae bacterium]
MSRADDALMLADAKALFAEGRAFAWNLISTRLTQFSYFDRQLEHPVWKGRKILDFGGNIGTFLVGAGEHVAHDDYWCIDLNPAVVEQGRRTYPQAHFVHYNRYSPQYNPNGVRHLPIPDCGVKFDMILAFSVFTHVDQNEMLELVGQLRGMLASEGVLAFTFFDPHYDLSLSDPARPPGSAVGHYLGSPGTNKIAKRAQWYVLIDDKLYAEPGDKFCHQTRVGTPLEDYCSYFTADYMAALFPGATVHPPISPEWQHCCILKKTE